MLHHKVYDTVSDAPWVVFLHGAGGSSSIWAAQLRSFSRRYRVLLVDLRGHGGSLHAPGIEPVETYDFNLIADDVIQVLDHVGIQSAHFVGVSLGTILIRELQNTDPGRFLSVVHSGAIVRLDLFSRFLIASGHLLKPVVPFYWLYSLFAWIIMPGGHQRETRAFFRREASRIPQKEFLRWFELTKSVHRVLDRFQSGQDPVPTLFVMGERDYMFLGDVERLCHARAEYRLHRIPGCGHVCNVEAPSAFNVAALAFLADIGSRTA